jgi:predicted CXXCH cytochrome family protein
MPKSIFKLLAALALLAAGAAALHARFGTGVALHLEHAECAACHLAGKDVTAAQAGMLTASQEVLCGKCHLAAIQVSHPSGLQPARTPPAAYPLDWKGDLTCSTCHQVHAAGNGLMRGSKTGKELCFMCHAAEFFNKMRDGGASLLAGHLARGVAPGAPTLDPYSLKCMECHGDNANPRLAAGIDRNGVVRHAGGTVNHPIGMSYQKALAYGGYRPLRTVERKLLLPDGRVSCVSCHGGYQKEHGKLLVANAGSALCYQCHDL